MSLQTPNCPLIVQTCVLRPELIDTIPNNYRIISNRLQVVGQVSHNILRRVLTTSIPSRQDLRSETGELGLSTYLWLISSTSVTVTCLAGKWENSKMSPGGHFL